jgi:hypothetical protein
MSIRRRVSFVLLLLFSAKLYSADLEPIDTTIWDKSLNLRGSLGYKDNVVLSKNNEEGSLFWQSGLEVSLFRLDAENGVTLSMFASGDDRRYFSAESVSHEEFIISQARVDWEMNDNWETGMAVNYSYLEEVFDASATEQVPQTLLVKSHRVGASPYISRDLPWNSTLALKFNADRQFFNEPLDGYWEYGPELDWKKRYGNHSEATLSYAFHDRPYNTREQLDLGFNDIPGSVLEFQQHEFEAVLDHSWDTNRTWRTRTRLGYLLNHDNGPGFYDYSRYRISQRIGYYGKAWEASVEGKVLYYDYVRQPVFETGEIRRMREYVLGLRVEKKLLGKLKVFFESEHEWVDSNNSLEEYTVNTVMSGVDWEY